MQEREYSVVYGSNKSSYTVEENSSNWRVSNSSSFSGFDELNNVERIKFSENAIGCEKVQPSRKDLADSQKYYRSICTTKPVSKGELFTRYNLSGKRPGTGLPTERLSEFFGRRASRDIGKNTLLREADSA